MSLSVNTSSNRVTTKQNFGTLYPNTKKKPVDSRLSKSERTGVAVSSMLGVAASLAILAKTATWKKFSLNPKRIMNTKIKDTYLYQVKFEEKEIVSMAAGSILGGLVGGIIIDDRSNNSKAEVKSKVGEAIIQFGNACVPILTVGQCARLGEVAEGKILSKISENSSKCIKHLAKLPKLALILAGLSAGMLIGNKAANYMKKVLLGCDEDRKIKASDMLMHWDDLCVGASFLSDGPIVQGVARLVPLAMLMAGYQVGCKGLDHKVSKIPQKPVEKKMQDNVAEVKSVDKSTSEDIKDINIKS